MDVGKLYIRTLPVITFSSLGLILQTACRVSKKFCLILLLSHWINNNKKSCNFIFSLFNDLTDPRKYFLDPLAIILHLPTELLARFFIYVSRKPLSTLNLLNMLNCYCDKKISGFFKRRSVHFYSQESFLPERSFLTFKMKFLEYLYKNYCENVIFFLLEAFLTYLTFTHCVYSLTFSFCSRIR